MFSPWKKKLRATPLENSPTVHSQKQAPKELEFRKYDADAWIKRAVQEKKHASSSHL